eukprot:CAMPEP_0116125882 /NCGR_PEP_ID=MMETSP0329-20121206/6042_1 /TAXON_ID=697910 /ORGANISM="Pseudo-nitzschia arenysensis, Strain B593" /LENGTH=1908 /DNA_ID=CAMNT_0003619941 /DNA_START=154 /DNA_END=5877 /DNA_ORIENTATION=+
MTQEPEKTEPHLITPAKIPQQLFWKDHIEAMTETKKIKYVLDEDLETLLREIFCIKDDDNNHELLKALQDQSITTWKMFRRLQPDVIESLTKQAGKSRVTISKNLRVELRILGEFIREKSKLTSEDGRKIEAIVPDEFDLYLEQYTDTMKTAAASNEADIPSAPSGRNVKSRTEKALDNWEKKKHDKTSFEILKDDAKYKIWKESFTAEIKVQGLSRMIDSEFKMIDLKDSYDKELFEKQSDYFWTVLLYALRNPVSEIVLGNHRDTSDARTAFLAVDSKLKGKVPQMYNVGDLSTKLQDLHISEHSGTRVQFISAWAEALRQLTKMASKEERLAYVHVRSLLMRAINSDVDLTTAFTTLPEPKDKDTAVRVMMDHMLEKAMLYDGRDSQHNAEDKKLTALLHKLDVDFDEGGYIVNKTSRGPTPDMKLPDGIYKGFTPDDKLTWRKMSGDAKRALVHACMKNGIQPSPATRNAYQHSYDATHMPPSVHAETVQANDPRLLAVHNINVLRHSLANAEAHLRSFETHDVPNAFTAMSSITTRSSPPDPSKLSESSKTATDSKVNSKTSSTQSLPNKSSLGRAHPARVLASKSETNVEQESQQGIVDYFGYRMINKNVIHYMFYDQDEQQRDGVFNNEILISKRNTRRTTTSALIDRGANGCVTGEDCVWIGGPTLERTVNITGMDNHQVLGIRVGTVGAYAISNRGPVICIFHEVAHTGKGQSIISSLQLEHYRNNVDERVCELGGGQQITTADGYNFPLSIVNGLPYLEMRTYTRTEFKKLPHVIMTSDQVWDPRVYDNRVSPNDQSYKQANPKNLHLLPHDDYDVKGEYIGANFTENKEEFKFWNSEREFNKNENIARCVEEAKAFRASIVDTDEWKAFDSEIHANSTPRTRHSNAVDYQALRPYFAWLTTDVIKNTFRNSTQYGFTPSSPDGNLFKRWNSPNPAMNVFRLQDDVLTDKIHSNTPAIDGGFKEAQIFFGRKSHIVHPEPISKSKSFLRCVQNFVRKWGAPIRILADHIRYHASFQVLDYLRILWIQLWFSEAYYQHQNPFERRYQTFKRAVNRLMDRTNTPPELWYLCICYVAYVLNRVSDPTLNNRQPIHVATGSIADISALTTFQWLEPVFYKKDNKQFTYPDTGEGHGYFVGVAENVGHAMTYKIWTSDTKKIIERSSVRSALDERFTNKRATPDDEGDAAPCNEDSSSLQQNHGEISKFPQRPSDFIYSKIRDSDLSNKPTPDDGNYGEPEYLDEDYDRSTDTRSQPGVRFSEDGTPMVILLGDDGQPKTDSFGNAILIPGKSEEDLRGVTFKHRQEDGTILRARILEPTEKNLVSPEGQKLASEFKFVYDKTQVEDTMAYNEIMNFLHRDQLEEEGMVWKFRRVIGHRQVNHRDPKYKNSGTNVSVEWENGEITEEPLKWMIKEDPIPMAQYALDNGLLDTDGWRSLKRIANRRKLFQRLVNQVRLRSFRTAPKYMYGYQVPRDYQEAMELDELNGNTRWADAVSLEMIQLHEYKVFTDKGQFSGSIPNGFKKIRVHLVFAVKHDGRHKARLVADGHLTDVPLDSVYAGVVSIRGLRICIFLAELNGLEAYATDVGNAYLEALTQEKVCIIAGPEFKDLEGHLLIVYKALYGLRSSGKQFGDLLASCLKELGFKASLAEPQIFMRENDGIYEYIATYVDDLCLVMRDPVGFLAILQEEPYSFKLKGSGPMSFHLGCGFERDNHGTLCMNPSKYIEKMAQAYHQMFGVKLGTRAQSPLEENDHPELDTSEFLDEDDTQKYQSLIGALQWLITLGRWDIQTAVMTLSGFRAKPRRGHLERAQRVCRYMNKFRHYMLRYRVDEPDLSDLDGAARVDWSKDVYEEQYEEIPDNIPKPLGKRVTLIHYFDANLMHDVLSGKAVTGCVHFANKTPIMW